MSENGQIALRIKIDKSNRSTSSLAAFIRHLFDNEIVQKIPQFKKMMEKLNPDSLVDDLLKFSLPAITWNHGKLLAVNGKTVMTGGQNFWNAYSCTGDGQGHHNLVDHQAIVVGDAAVSAHRWADYFWRYANHNSVSRVLCH